MTNQPFDDPLKELQNALAVEPSPAFAARVRTRIAQSGGRSSWPAWQWLVAAAVMALVVLGAGVWRVSVAGDRMLAERTAAQVLGSPLASEGGPSAVLTRATPTAKAPAMAVPARVAIAPGPEVLVPPDQAIVLNQLLAGLRERRTANRLATETPVVVFEELPEIIPVRIEPIRIDPIVPSSPPSGGKEKNQ